MKTIVFFRGNRTADIIHDATGHGLAVGREVVVVRRNSDHVLAADTDITVREFDAYDHDVIVVANGGTTAQLVPVLAGVIRDASRFLVYDVQRDGIALLAASEHGIDEGGCCRGCGVKVAITEFDESRDCCVCPRPSL